MNGTPGPYSTVKPGEWFPVPMRNHREQCCGCGLVHVVDFRVVQKGARMHIEFRCWRDDKATNRIRKRAGIVVLRA